MPFLPGRSDVHYQHIGLAVLLQFGTQLAVVRRLGDDLRVGVLGQHLHDAATNDRVVVDDDQPNRHRDSPRPTLRTRWRAGGQRRNREHHGRAAARRRRHLGPAVESAGALEQAAHAEARRDRKAVRLETGTVVGDLERDFILECKELHVHGACARVLAHIRQRFLRDTVERSCTVRCDVELVAIAAEIDRQAGALAEAPRQPFQRGDQAGVEHGRPQRVLDAVRRHHRGFEQLLDCVHAAAMLGIGAELARQSHHFELKRRQGAAHVVVNFLSNGATLVFLGALQMLCQRMQLAFAFDEGGRGAAGLAPCACSAQAVLQGGCDAEHPRLQDEVISPRVQRSHRQFLGHLARQHDDWDVGIDGLGDLERRKRIEARQVVIGDDGVDRALRERIAHAGLVFDADGARTQALAHQHREQQFVVEFGVFDNDQAWCSGVGRRHGGRDCGGLRWGLQDATRPGWPPLP